MIILLITYLFMKMHVLEIIYQASEITFFPQLHIIGIHINSNYYART